MLNSGNPDAYIGVVRDPHWSQAQEIFASNGGNDGAMDTVYCLREPEPYEEFPDPTLYCDIRRLEFTYSYRDGHCYTVYGELLPYELEEEVRASGLVHRGDTSSYESMLELIGSVNNLSLGDITLEW